MPRAERKPLPMARWFLGRRLAVRALLLSGLIANSACAAGPRWVTGPPYFTGPAGVPVAWSTNPLYFTDPGDLSAYVDHAAADALVAAAANVWNVPTASIVVSYGGALTEHVSSANAHLSESGPVFPADVQAANDAAIQIAVIYDSDGSVTDLLLGAGASSPAECRENGVTEDVDAINPAGYIQHAILVLNGRCTGAAPQQQLQMQYQLERAFGRVLGLGWSQTNDNVFTRTPQPNPQQAQHWPIMHPIDIVCGAYTYLCLPQPFTLRDDDVASISELYPMLIYYGFPASPPAPGKTWSYVQASAAYGTVSFPTGQGMQGVNVELQRRQGGWDIPENFYDVSAVSGMLFQQNAGNPVTGPVSGLAASMGSTDGRLEGYYNFGWIPDIDPMGASNGPMMALLTTEAINPLYVGAHAVGPYVAGGVEPSGSPMTALIQNALWPNEYPWDPQQTNLASVDAADDCSTGGDGTETEPLPVTAGGWWTGVLCAHAHTAWFSFSAQAGRTATLEVTALDENGLATTAKAMPLIGVWNAGDATGTLPTVAATPSAFNTMALGVTAAGVSMAQAGALRFVIADARGDGRPDFAYKARVLYADSIQPAATSVNGGLITISGMGFRAGNEVLVNGVPAQVASWTPTTIVAVAPMESAFAVESARPLDVAVVDLATGGSTVMTGALTYSTGVAPDGLTLVTAPTGTVLVGAPSQFAVRATLGDGVTPVAGLPVAFTVSAGSAALGGCTGSPCMASTDATGLAQVSLTATAFGAVTVQASAVGAAQTASFTAVARSIAMMQPAEYVAAGATVTWAPEAAAVENGSPSAGIAVTWSSGAGMVLSPASSVTGANGMAQVSATAGPLAAGAQATGEACAWTTVCASFATVGVDPAVWRVVVVSGAGQTVADGAAFAPVVLMVTDTSGNPVAEAPVTIYQTVDAANAPCPARGPCPIAPVVAKSTTAATSDANGLVSVTPAQTAGAGEVTNIAVVAGTQGFASLSLTQQP